MAKHNKLAHLENLRLNNCGATGIRHGVVASLGKCPALSVCPSALRILDIHDTGARINAKVRLQTKRGPVNIARNTLGDAKFSRGLRHSLRYTACSPLLLRLVL